MLPRPNPFGTGDSPFPLGENPFQFRAPSLRNLPPSNHQNVAAPSTQQDARQRPPKELRLFDVCLPRGGVANFLESSDEPHGHTGAVLRQNRDLVLQQRGAPSAFSVDTLAGGIAQGCSTAAILAYINSYDKDTIKPLLEKPPIASAPPGRRVQCHPVLFYAIERNDVEIVRTLLEYGADPKACDMWDVPPVAYAVLRSKWTVLDPTEVVKTLLGYGADPEAVPRDMWEDYMKHPTAEMKTASNGQDRHSASLWCKHRHRNILAETLSLSIRYYLAKASEIKPVQARGMQLAQAYDYAALLKVPYLIVGQTFACKFVVEVVTSHIGMNIKRPLVMAFVGLSGHGKTELATKMGSLLGVTITVVDCAQMRSDFGLFGPRQGYHGNDRGSQLNNHLAEFDGQRSVVFMDEFDKTDQEVRNSLLLLLDSGAYHDRRNNQRIDASKTIWIFATNLGDHAITNFYHEHMEGVTKASELAMVPHKTLQNELKTLFRHAFGAPMAGRLKNVAPFYPFSPPEQAVIVRKFLSELVDELRRDIDRSPATKRYPGHVHLNIQNDAKLCAHIAAESYLPDLGARSLTSGIDDVRSAFFTSFTETEELMDEEMNKRGLMRYTVRLVPVTGGEPEDREVVVVRDGEQDYYRGQGTKAVEYEDEGAGDGLEVSRTQGSRGKPVSNGTDEEL